MRDGVFLGIEYLGIKLCYILQCISVTEKKLLFVDVGRVVLKHIKILSSKCVCVVLFFFFPLLLVVSVCE